MSRLFDGVNDVLIAGTQAGQVGPCSISAWWYNPAAGLGTFPVPPVLDDFNRADGDPGPDWTPSIWDEGKLVISGNMVRAIVGTPGGRAMRWIPASFSDPLDIYATLGVDGREFLDLWYCISNGDMPSSLDGYRIQFDYSSGTDTLWLQRVDNGVPIDLGSLSQELAVGDGYGVRLANGEHQVYHKPAAGAWGAIGSPVTDLAYVTGEVGIHIEYSTDTDDGALDEFGAGSASGGGGSGTDVLFSKGTSGGAHEFSLGVDWPTGKFQCGSSVNAIQESSVSLAEVTGWVHLAATYSGSPDEGGDRTWRLWVNGGNVGSAYGISDPSTAMMTFAIGAGSAGTTAFSVGRLAESAYWQREITPAEVAQLAEGADARMIRDPVRYWQVPGSASPEPELIAADDATVTGTTLADHAPVNAYDPSTASAMMLGAG